MARRLFVLAAFILLAGCNSSAITAHFSKGPLEVPVESVASNPMSKSVLLAVRASQINGHTGVYNGHGSATVLNWGGHVGIVTNWHVVKDKDHKSLYLTGNGHAQLVGPFKRIAGRDVAWFEMPDLPRAWVPLYVAAHNINYGPSVSWGYPHTEDALVGLRTTDEGSLLVDGLVHREHNGIAIPGMSGGPVLNKHGRVYAIVSITQWPLNNRHFPATISDIRPR